MATASACASSTEWLEEYLLGIATPFTHFAPSASIAMAATKAESMPPINQGLQI